MVRPSRGAIRADRALDDADQILDRDDGRDLDPGQLHPETVLEGDGQDDVRGLSVATVTED